MSTDYTSLEEGQRRVTSFESTQTSILQSMLQEAYNFASAVPDKVHIYFQIGDGKASAGFLFEASGRILEIDTIGEATAAIDYIPDAGHVQMLMDRTAQTIVQFISHCVSSQRPIPSEVWTTAIPAETAIHTTSGYNFSRSLPTTQDAIAKWKKDLEDSSYAVFRNVALLELPPF